MNTFMNLIKRSSEVRVIKGGVEASGRVRASLLLAFDLPAGLWAPASSSSSSVKSTGMLTQKLRRLVQDPEAIAKDGDLIVMLFF